MKIAVRIRPLSVVEKARNPVEVVQPFHENIILFRPPARSALKVTSDGDIEETEQRFSFHRVFGPTCSQHHIYDTMVRPLLDDVFKGINASVLLYGPTGSGKTYTMFGTPSSPGIVPTLARDLYSALQNQEHRTELKMSFLEIYNERVRDLLALQQISLDVHMDHTGQAHIRNMSEHCPKDLQEFFHLLDRGSQKRVQAATGANEVSSRSHALLLLTIECQISNTEAGLLRRTSQITLVDLAGSERAAATENRGMRQKEGANINQSLLALGNVIQALSSGDSKFVNYRASRLTRLLKSCLGGNCKTVFIAALSPSVFTTEDSRNTLAYATRVMNIPVDAHVNETIVRRHITEYESAIRDLNTENHSLRQRVSELEELLQKQYTQRAIHSENSPTAINPIDTSDHGENGLRDIGNQETGRSTPVVLQGGVGKSDQLNSIQDPFQELWTRMQYIKVQLEQAQRKVQNTDEAMDQQLEEKMRSVNQTIMKWIEQEHREGVNEVEPIAVVTAKQQIIDISRKKRTIAQNRVAAAKELATATKDLLAEHQVLPSGLPLVWKESFATLLNEMVMYSTRCFEAEQMSTYYFNRNRVLETRLEEARLSIQKYHQCAVERKTGARESNTIMSVDWVAAEGWAASSQQEDPMQMIRVFRDVLLRQGKPRPKSPRSRQSIRLDTLEVARKVVRAKNGSGTLGRGPPAEPVLGKFASSNVIARIRSADTTNAAIANLVKKHSSSNMSRLQRSCSVNAFTLNGLSGAANRSPSSLNIPVSGNVPSSVPSLFGSNHVTSPPQVQSPMNIRRSDSAASALPNCTLTNSALQNVLPSTLSTTKEHRVISPPLNNNHNSPIRAGSPKELGERRESRVKAITPLTPSKLRYVDPATRKATLKQ